MKKVSLLIICLALTVLPVLSKSADKNEEKNDSPKVFVYHIPDEIEDDGNISNEEKQEQTEIITSDDITEDTSPKTTVRETSNIANEEENDDYAIDDMYKDVLHGYAAYDEGEEDTITLEDDIKDFHELNIKIPKKVDAVKFYGLETPSLLSDNEIYTKYNGLEYSIAPVYNRQAKSIGGFSAGTMYWQGIDTAELEQSTSVFSRYDGKYFAVSTIYSKTVNSTNNTYSDYLKFSPELKINQYLTLREVFSNNMATNRKKAEFYISVNPFGFKDTERLRLEVGTSTSYDENYSFIKNQFKFLTRIKL